MADAERGEASEQRNSAVLKGLDPILAPELLSALRCMGHGDEIALVDANFPASSLGVPVIRLDRASVTRALDAVLSVLPLDDFVPEATWRMQVGDQADQEIPIFAGFREIIARRAGPHVRLASLERFAFYERTCGAFRVVATGEDRLYGNVLLKKGVVRPGGAELFAPAFASRRDLEEIIELLAFLFDAGFAGGLHATRVRRAIATSPDCGHAHGRPRGWAASPPR